MKRMRAKIIFCTALFLLICGALAGVYVYMTNAMDYTSVDYILRYQHGHMQFNDPGDTIAATSPDRCGYKVIGNLHLDIKYGKMTIHVVPKCFETPDFMNKLKQIGIEIKYRQKDDGTYQYKVTYWGEEIDEYSRLN